MVNRTPKQEEAFQKVVRRLRPYQRGGVAFLRKVKKGILADTMGLGKTLQALVAIEYELAYPAIIVTPASVVETVRKEVAKWLPWRQVQVVQGKTRDLLSKHFVVIGAQNLHRYMDLLEGHPWETVVLDEAHYFKNHRSTRSQMAERVVKGVERIYCLTGTPIKNRRNDLVMQLELVGHLNTVLRKHPLWRHRIRGQRRISRDEAELAFKEIPAEVIHAALIESCMLRRVPEDVGEELPALQRSVLPMEPSRRAGIVRAEKAFVEWAKGVSEANLSDQEMRTTIRMKGVALVQKIKEQTAIAKVPLIVEWAESLKAQGEKAVIFTYHKSVAEELRAALRGNGGSKVGHIHGGLLQSERTEVIDLMGELDYVVATMDSTGHGINGMQQHAANLMFAELDHTPTKHEQCEGRLRRLGQAKPTVQAVYCAVRGTVDDAGMERLNEKWVDNLGVIDGVEAGEDSEFLNNLVERIIKQRPWENEGKITWGASGNSVPVGLPSPGPTEGLPHDDEEGDGEDDFDDQGDVAAERPMANHRQRDMSKLAPYLEELCGPGKPYRTTEEAIERALWFVKTIGHEALQATAEELVVARRDPTATSG